MSGAVAVPGTCRVCGCTDVNPCLSRGGDGNPLEACHWIDPDHTLCSNPRCVAEVQIDELIEMCFPAEAA